MIHLLKWNIRTRNIMGGIGETLWKIRQYDRFNWISGTYEFTRTIQTICINGNFSRQLKKFKIRRKSLFSVFQRDVAKRSHGVSHLYSDSTNRRFCIIFCEEINEFCLKMVIKKVFFLALVLNISVQKALDDVWSYQQVRTPFPLSAVKAHQNSYVALWYRHGKPVMGRAWNDTGVVQCEFAVDKKSYKDSDVGGIIQLLTYEGTHMTKNYFYEWVPVALWKGEHGNELAIRQIVRCGNAAPIFWPENQALGNYDIEEKKGTFSVAGKFMEVADQLVLNEMRVLVRNTEGGPPHCPCAQCNEVSKCKKNKQWCLETENDSKTSDGQRLGRLLLWSSMANRQTACESARTTSEDPWRTSGACGGIVVQTRKSSYGKSVEQGRKNGRIFHRVGSSEYMNERIIATERNTLERALVRCRRLLNCQRPLLVLTTSGCLTRKLASTERRIMRPFTSTLSLPVSSWMPRTMKCLVNISYG